MMPNLLILKTNTTTVGKIFCALLPFGSRKLYLALILQELKDFGLFFLRHWVFKENLEF